MIRKIGVKEFTHMMDLYLRSTGKVKEDEEFKFIGINPNDLEKFFEIEISKIEPKFEKLEDIVK